MKARIRERFIVLMVSDAMAMLFSFVIAILLGHKASFSLALPFQYMSGFVALVLSTLFGSFYL